MELVWLFLSAWIAAAIHMLTKIAKVNKLSNGDANYRQFFKIEWPYMAISILTIILALIAHENIAKIQVMDKVLGDWMYVVFMIVGWASDSILYNTIGRLENKVIKEIKEKTK